MAAGWQYIWRILLMAALLAGSAFCSGSETAFFHLSRRQITQFAKSKHRVEHLIAEILQQPSRFLTTLLFSNMLVNISYFALASVFSVKIGQIAGPGTGSACAAAFFVLLLLFGEMLPKSLAYSNTARFCRWASMPCYLGLRVLGPILAGLDFFIIRPFCRLLIGTISSAEHPVNLGQLKLILDSSTRRGLISKDENQLLMEVIKFGYLKVRHVMQPRVDMLACEENTPPDAIRGLLHEHHKKTIPVYRGRIDSIIGVLSFRTLLLNPDKPIASLLEPVSFVPEQKTVESLLEDFRTRKNEFAVVVDEYGGIAGSVELEDILEELVYPADLPEGRQPVEVVGPLTYRLSADLPIHEWIDAADMEPEHQRLTTVGGLVTALLGRIARHGDSVHWKTLEFTVEKVKKNRIETLILSLQSPGADAEKETDQ